MDTRIFAMAVVAGGTSAALAGNILVTNSPGLGNSFTLTAGDLSGSVFGTGTPPNLNNTALESIHMSLHASGIATEDYVTIVPAWTSHGLGFFALFDDELAPGNAGNVDTDLRFASTIQEMSGAGIDVWRNDLGDMQWLAGSLGGTLQNNINFEWDESDRGDAVAVSGLEVGDNGTWDFNAQFSGTPGSGFGVSNDFQFVSWNPALGVSGEWEVVALGDFSSGYTWSSFDWEVIPLPTSGAMAGMTMLALGVRRRRQD